MVHQYTKIKQYIKLE